MSREANRAPSIAELNHGLHRRYLTWFVLGVPAFLIVIGIFSLMISNALAVVV